MSDESANLVIRGLTFTSQCSLCKTHLKVIKLFCPSIVIFLGELGGNWEEGFGRYCF